MGLRRGKHGESEGKAPSWARVWGPTEDESGHLVLTCGGDILSCLCREQPALDLQNALENLGELLMDTGTVGWRCHPKPQAAGSGALGVVNSKRSF